MFIVHPPSIMLFCTPSMAPTNPECVLVNRSLAWNQLTGTIPIELVALTRLTNLYADALCWHPLPATILVNLMCHDINSLRKFLQF